MVAIKLVVLSLACVCATAVPDNAPPQVTRNTIFADERFEGEVFEKLDVFADTELTSDISPYRLPTTTRPSNYNLTWEIDVEDHSFSGEVVINLQATEENVNEIVIHSDRLSIDSVVLTPLGANVNTSFTLDDYYKFLKVHLTDNLLLNVNYSLTIKFKGNMREDMYGIYYSWYRNEGSDTKIRWMATTQFQATAARSAFPCYDEPSFKATFDVTIRRPKGYRSWFCTKQNGEPQEAASRPGYYNDNYHTTPLMSTYLLALIVADYRETLSPEPEHSRGIQHEVIAREGAIKAGQGNFAAEVGQALLYWMEDHTGFPFLEQNANLKMTQAAIPDFGAGAMENWGLLTYREAYLLYEEGETNSYFKQLICYILSHEIAHMWFGNLVTNDWWDVLWLNEGFARYYQYFLTANAALEYTEVPKMGLERRFINEQVHTALLTDSADHPQPLTNPGVDSPRSVSNMFSTISYNKGAAVIRMTEHLLGTPTHTEGLKTYLKHRKFNTSTPLDLFTELDLAGRTAGAFEAYGADFDFFEYYKSWTEQPGHPVLQVIIDHHSGQMRIYQRRFNINDGFSHEGTRYVIPITFTSADNANFTNTKPSHILTEPFTIINRNVVGNHWTIFNIQQTGFYRVYYDEYTWHLITQALKDPVQRNRIHEYNRAQIVNDVFQFARSGIMSYQRALSILSYLQFETEYVPWVTAITGFNWLRNRIHGNTELAQQLDDQIRDWAEPLMNTLTYNPIAGEDFMEGYLRYQLAAFMCNLGDSQCKVAAAEQFDRMKNGVVDVPVDNRNWVYCNALRRGNEEDFEFLWARFETHNVYTEKILLLQTLGCTSHEGSLRKYLDAIFQSDYIRPQDYTTAFGNAVSGNEENTQRVFSYIKDHLPVVTREFGNAATPLSYVTARLRNKAEVEQFREWAKNTQSLLGSDYNSIDQAASTTLDSFEWASVAAEDLTGFFENPPTEFPSTEQTPSTVGPTSAQPGLSEPTTPELPSSAVTSFISIFILALAGFTHIIV